MTWTYGASEEAHFFSPNFEILFPAYFTVLQLFMNFLLALFYEYLVLIDFDTLTFCVSIVLDVRLTKKRDNTSLIWWEIYPIKLTPIEYLNIPIPV